MTDKEKLVELLCKVQDYGTKNTCEGWSVTVECKDNETVVDELIANGVTVQEWIPVAERLPEPFVPVLICREKEPGKRIVEQGFKDLGKWWKVYGTRVTTIISWRPLPQPPKGE